MAHSLTASDLCSLVFAVPLLFGRMSEQV